jgi:hypothetical protein
VVDGGADGAVEVDGEQLAVAHLQPAVERRDARVVEGDVGLAGAADHGLDGRHDFELLAGVGAGDHLEFCDHGGASGGGRTSAGTIESTGAPPAGQPQEGADVTSQNADAVPSDF